MGRNNIAAIVLAVIALTLGIAIKLYVGRRRFYRRNQAGLEGFKNYRNAIITPFFETLLTFISGLLIILGILCLAGATFIGK